MVFAGVAPGMVTFNVVSGVVSASTLAGDFLDFLVDSHNPSEYDFWLLSRASDLLDSISAIFDLWVFGRSADLLTSSLTLESIDNSDEVLEASVALIASLRLEDLDTIELHSSVSLSPF